MSEVKLIDPSEITLTDEIGDGATAVVHKGIYNSQQVAVKKFNGSCPLSQKKQFKNELDILAKINHENIIKIFGYCDKRNDTFIVFELMEGGSLFDLLASDERQINSCSLVKDICNGMAFLHAQSVLHLDLKSPNVLLDKSKNHAKLTDFGIAKISTMTTIASSAIKTNSAKGTMRWMAPEISKGLPGTRKSDVWSFGCILLEFITRKLPFESINEQALFLTLQNDKTELPIRVEQFSYIMASILCKCLKRNVNDRPTFDQLSQLLEKCTPKDFEIGKIDTNVKPESIKTLTDLNKFIEDVKSNQGEVNRKKIEEEAKKIVDQKQREYEMQKKHDEEIAKIKMEQKEKELEQQKKLNEEMNRNLKETTDRLGRVNLRQNEFSSQREPEYFDSPSSFFSRPSSSFSPFFSNSPFDTRYSFGQSHSGRPTGEFHVSNGSANGRAIFEGSRGGRFYINSNGNKTYKRN